MMIPLEKRLFWYLNGDRELDLENPSNVDMYVQQVLSHGKADDVRELIMMLKPEVFKKSLERIKRYLPREVRKFWEAGLGDTG